MFWPLPERFWGHRVVNGDYSDARPCDPANGVDRNPVVVGLHYKTSKGVEQRIKGLEKTLKGGLTEFSIPVGKPSDVRQQGMQRFREHYLEKNGLGRMWANPSGAMPTIVTQVHEIDGWLCVAGTPVHEGASNWTDEV